MTRLMEIERQQGVVTNHTQFGRQIQQFGYDAIDEIAPEYTWFHGGWQDGGCLMFARALQEWSADALGLAVIRSSRNPEVVQHVVCQIGENLYVDSDGVGTAQDMCRKAADLEFVAGAYLEGADADTDMGEIVDHPGLRGHLVELATERLGAFDRGMVEDCGRLSAPPVC